MTATFAQGVDCLVETMVVTVVCLRDGWIYVLRAITGAGVAGVI